MGSTKKYSEDFKRSCVQKLLMPDSIGLNATASKCNIPPSTLYTWKTKYAKLSTMEKSKKIQSWSPEQKLEALIKTASMSEEELGEYLRSNGLHSSDLESFKSSYIDNVSIKGRPKLDPEVTALRKENSKLSRDLRKKTELLPNIVPESFF